MKYLDELLQHLIKMFIEGGDLKEFSDYTIKIREIFKIDNKIRESCKEEEA